MFDTHMHTKFSGDSDAEPPLLIKKAKDLNLSGLCFTDHHDMDNIHEPDLFLLNFPAYSAEISAIKEQYTSDDFSVFMGIEMGLVADRVDTMREILDNYPFDYCLGAVHTLYGIDPYYDDYFEGHDVSKKYEEHLLYTLKNIEVFPEFDSLAHLDYMVRYGTDFCLRKGLEVVPLGCEELISEILLALIKRDICLEVNTGAFRTSLNRTNPDFDVIKKYKDLGGKLITLGSDAHRYEHVGLKFPEVREKLLDIGFKSQMVFINRKPNEFPL